MADRSMQGSNIEPGLVTRIAAGLRYALTGSTPDDWFGPMQPMAPALNTRQAEETGVAGR